MMILKVKYLFPNLPELISDPLDSGFDIEPVDNWLESLIEVGDEGK